MTLRVAAAAALVARAALRPGDGSRSRAARPDRNPPPAGALGHPVPAVRVVRARGRAPRDGRGRAEAREGRHAGPARRRGRTRSAATRVLTYLEWWLMPEEARKVPWILIERPGTRELLGFPKDKPGFKHVSFDELASSARFQSVVDSLRSRPRDRFRSTRPRSCEIDTPRRDVPPGRAAAERGRGAKPEELRGRPADHPAEEAMKRGVLYQWQPVDGARTPYPRLCVAAKDGRPRSKRRSRT